MNARGTESIKQEIENFAQPGTKQGREYFYLRLQQSVRQIPVPTSYKNIPDAYTFVLSIVLIAYLKYVSPGALNRRTTRMDRARDDAQLSKRQKKIVNQLDNLRDDRNIKYLHYELYDPAELVCQHGRDRKKCEGLYSHRARLLLMDKPPFNKFTQYHLTNLRTQFGDLLRSPSEDYCVPSPPPFLSTLRQVVPEGRPKNELIDFLMNEIVGWLKEAGWKVSKALRLLNDILYFCFGEKYEEDALRKRWQRLTERTTKPRKPTPIS